MNARLLFQKTNINVFFLLIIILTLEPALTGASELTPAGGIITLAGPPTGQTLHGTGCNYHDVAVAEDGSFVVTWVFKTASTFSTGESEDLSVLTVYARRFNADGIPQTEIIEVCDGFTPKENSWHVYPRVACDDDGNFVVCWITFNPTFRPNVVGETKKVNINARLFDAAGLPRSDVFFISDGQFRFSIEHTGISIAENIGVSMNGHGDFVVTWKGENSIKLKRFDPDGASLDPEPIWVVPESQASHPLFDGVSWRPSVEIDSDGGFVTAWSNYYYFNGPGIYFESMITMMRQFDNNGSPVGPVKQVAASFGSNYSKRGVPETSPVIAMNDEGEFAVSYCRYDYRYDFDDAGYCFYDNKGNTQGRNKKINVFIKENSLVNAMDKDGNLIIGWLGCDGKTSCLYNEAIYLMPATRRFVASKKIIRVAGNVPQDPLEKVPYTSFPALDVSKDGRIIVVWHDNENIFGRIYTIH